MRSIRVKRTNLRREIEIRDEVIHTLCYRWVIFNQESGNSHARADFQAMNLIERARLGHLKRDRDLLPPNVRLWSTLYAAYYATPGRVSMATHPPFEPLPPEVAETAEQAAFLAAQYWAAVPSFKQWLEERQRVALAKPRTTRTGRTAKIRSTKGID